MKGALRLALMCVCLAFPVWAGKPLHKYYLSITEIEANPKAKILKISSRLFSDDLEKSVRDLHAQQRPLEKFKGVNHENLQAYLSAHVKLRSGKRLYTVKLIGFEQDAEVTWCHMEMAYQAGKVRQTLVNSLLFDQLPEQVNLVTIKSPISKRSYRLAYPDSVVVFGKD
jgi:hypothetical protein